MVTPKFQHMIAFGNSCSTAAGLSRLGLREKSGPYDWFISGITLNLSLLKNHFADFLNPENLVHRYHPLNNGQYFDQKLQIGFIHDFDPSQDAPPLSEQIGAVQAKYQRRIDYLFECLKEPTLLVEMIGDRDAEYANEHLDEILAYLRSFNPGNDILFMTNMIEDVSKYPNLKIYKVQFHSNDHIAGRCFDDNPELVAYLTDPTTYPAEKRARNLDFFIKKQLMVDDDISFNEMRIDKERLEYENRAFAQWVEALSAGRKLTDQLVADGVKKVGLIGGNEFTRLLIPRLKEVGIEPVFVTGWRLDGVEFCGVPIRRHVHKPPTEEERKQMEAENRERAEKGLPPIRHKRRNFLKRIPGIEEVDTIIALEVEMAYFMSQNHDYEELGLKFYTVTDLIGGEPLVYAPKYE